VSFFAMRAMGPIVLVTVSLLLSSISAWLSAPEIPPLRYFIYRKTGMRREGDASMASRGKLYSSIEIGIAIEIDCFTDDNRSGYKAIRSIGTNDQGAE
jgi:hypothetical protein